MRLRSKLWAVAVVAVMPLPLYAASCTTQADLQPQDRQAIADAAARLAQAVIVDDESTLQSALETSQAAEWEGIRGAVQQLAPLVKDGQAQLRSAYLLDATSLTAPADTQFFCSNATASLTVTINMRALPPGRYAIVIADAAGAPLAGQIGLVLAFDSGAWKLAGLNIRQGAFDGHDGVWYWTRGRTLAKSDPWSAWYCYEAARWLLIPFDFISSPNLEKLDQEQGEIQGSPRNAFPYSLQQGDRSWKFDSVRLDTSLRQSDLGVNYESTGVTDAAALRTEAVNALSALLKAQPGLRQNFHGLWAYSVKDGKVTPVMELPMAQIP